jgi:hypothetical protein
MTPLPKGLAAAAERAAAKRDAEIEALRKDAERYRWLRENRVSENDDGEKCVYFWADFGYSGGLDAAIDAAMREQTP